MGTQLPLPKKGTEPPSLGPCLLWPNGWMDQDATWHEGRPQSRRLCVRWDPAPLLHPNKGGGVFSPIFGPFILWPNGWMHQDATWYGGRPRPRQLCVRWGPSSPSPKRGQSPQFLAHIYCGQTAGWMKLVGLLGMVVGLGPGDFVLDGDPAPFLQKGA